MPPFRTQFVTSPVRSDTLMYTSVSLKNALILFMYPALCYACRCSECSPSIGKRVLVLFSDGVWYKGVINDKVRTAPTRAASTASGWQKRKGGGKAGDEVGSKDEWSVLFDDTDTRTFFTGEYEGQAIQGGQSQNSRVGPDRSKGLVSPISRYFHFLHTGVGP